MIRVRQQAAVVLAEQSIAIQRDAVISPVPQPTRENAQQAQGLPAAGQLTDDFKKGI